VYVLRSGARFLVVSYLTAVNHYGPSFDPDGIVELAYSATTFGDALQLLDYGDIYGEHYRRWKAMLSSVDDACLCRCPCEQAVREATIQVEET
jgi:hypothetical protein